MHIEYLDQIIKLLYQSKIYKKDKEIIDFEDGLEELFQEFYQTKQKKKKIFFIGNGGSAAIASHMTIDFMKNGGMHTISLLDSSIITCLGNDYSYANIYDKQIKMLADHEDLLVAISSSGNSENIINAIDVAKEIGARVVTFSGFKLDNRIRTKGDLNVYVPVEHYGMVESIHNLLLQQVVDTIVKYDGVN